MRRRVIFVVIVVVCFFASVNFAESVRVGFKATAQVTPLLFGVPLRPYAHTAVESSSTVGPSLELLLPAHITFEASGLRKRMGYNDTIITSVGLGPRRSVEYRDTTATLWEIPMLVKWRMREARVSPVIGGGLALRHVGGKTHAYGVLASSIPTVPLTPFDRMENIRELEKTWTQGLTSTVGMSVQVGFLHFSPDIRYTRWVNFAFRDPHPNIVVPVVVSKRDQIDVLMGVTFSFK